MTAVTITAILRAKNGFEEALQAELQKVAIGSKKEAGNIQYDVNRSIDDKGTFVFYEIWQDQQVLEEHLTTEHYQTYRRNIESIVESREVYKLRQLSKG
ncbi:putative quinol monooxygenase [Ectobacillus sp. sgz5001026]|uniref:putative quinol monooxygenase n=1 Tax=Ectobacillus sp. sgz5001026 TaxID=3242473 RepID=UPI0036D41950